MILRLTEEWKEKLGKGFFAGLVLMDLSKAFDYIPRDLLIAKLNAYGFGGKSLVFLYSYLKRRKRCVNINNIQSTFQTLPSWAPQKSILGPLLFNIFINDLIGFTKSLYYTILQMITQYGFWKEITLLKETLRNEAEIVIQWFKDNFMIVNPEKFQAMVIHWFSWKKALIEAYVFSSFNCCPLVWHFTSITSTNKTEWIQKRALRLLYNDYTSNCESFCKSK